jgi:hypothetical protein
MKLLTVAFILLTLAAGLPAAEGKFVDLGIPVLRAGVYKQTLGPDERGEMTKIYAIFTQDAAPIFLVQIDPYTGASRQYNAPIGTHPWGLVVGPDNCVYIGTADEEAGGGLLLRFDPARPEKGVVNLGKMAESETYVWALARGEKDGCIYGCSYGNGKITAYNTDTGRMPDYGQMKPGQQYTRPIVVGKSTIPRGRRSWPEPRSRNWPGADGGAAQSGRRQRLPARQREMVSLDRRQGSADRRIGAAGGRGAATQRRPRTGRY